MSERSDVAVSTHRVTCHRDVSPSVVQTRSLGFVNMQIGGKDLQPPGLRLTISR